ncbi:MAG: SoxR reducing system RseC family protein [Pseudomonadota bacterium]
MVSQPTIEQRARVAAIRDGRLGLSPLRRADCARCASGQGCGAQLFGPRPSASALLWLPSPLASTLRVGDEVRLSVSAALLQRSSLVLYALPLLCMLLVVAIAAALQLAEPMQALVALLSLALSMLLRRRYQARHRASDAALIGVASVPCASVARPEHDGDGSPPP